MAIRKLGIPLDELPDNGSPYRPNASGGFRSKMVLGATPAAGVADDASTTLTFQPKEDCALDFLSLECTLPTTGARLYGAYVTEIKVNTDTLFSSTDTGNGMPISAFYHDAVQRPLFGHKVTSKDTVTVTIKNVNGAAVDIAGAFHVL